MKNEEIEKSKKSETTRVILNVPKQFDIAFKKLALKRGISKSSMIIYAMSWYLDYNKSMDLMPKLIDLMKIDKNELE